MIENLIIIIPTHNRQHYLRRVVKYYSSFPCRVYICDSSKVKAAVECSDNITYRWVPQSYFYGKVLDVLNETSADFYALSPDDDFLKLETLMECYEYLRKNNEFVMANGRQYLFHKEYDMRLFYNPGTNGFKDKNVINNDRDGVKYFWKHYQNVLWSLFRRKAILNAFTVLANSGFKNGNFVEIVLSIESLKLGSVFISDNPFNFMEINPSEHWGNTTLPISWESYVKSSGLRKDIKTFYNFYNGDYVAKISLRLHMGRPLIEICRLCYNRLRRLIGKLQSAKGKTVINEMSLPEAEDSIMVKRITVANKEMAE